MSHQDTKPAILHPMVWIGSAGMLLIALLPMPYGFYTALRIVVCIAACYLVYFEYGRASRVSGWLVFLIALAIVFNPVIPIYLAREIWAPIDVGAAIALNVHWRQARRSADSMAATK